MGNTIKCPACGATVDHLWVQWFPVEATNEYLPILEGRDGALVLRVDHAESDWQGIDETEPHYFCPECNGEIKAEALGVSEIIEEVD